MFNIFNLEKFHIAFHSVRGASYDSVIEGHPRELLQ